VSLNIHQFCADLALDNPFVFIKTVLQTGAATNALAYCSCI